MEKMEVLRKLDDDKLVDVVRNYKRYGYDDRLRDHAVGLLHERGWTRDKLQAHGYHLDNPGYDEAVRQYKAYCRNSVIGICALVFSVGVLVLVYLLFLFLAYRNVVKFYRALGREADGSILSFGLIVYFQLKDKMKEELRGMR